MMDVLGFEVNDDNIWPEFYMRKFGTETWAVSQWKARVSWKEEEDDS